MSFFFRWRVPRRDIRPRELPPLEECTSEQQLRAEGWRHVLALCRRRRRGRFVFTSEGRLPEAGAEPPWLAALAARAAVSPPRAADGRRGRRAATAGRGAARGAARGGRAQGRRRTASRGACAGARGLHARPALSARGERSGGRGGCFRSAVGGWRAARWRRSGGERREVMIWKIWKDLGGPYQIRARDKEQKQSASPHAPIAPRVVYPRRCALRLRPRYSWWATPPSCERRSPQLCHFPVATRQQTNDCGQQRASVMANTQT